MPALGTGSFPALLYIGGDLSNRAGGSYDLAALHTVGSSVDLAGGRYFRDLTSLDAVGGDVIAGGDLEDLSGFGNLR